MISFKELRILYIVWWISWKENGTIMILITGFACAPVSLYKHSSN
jgi:hypothetical protein